MAMSTITAPLMMSIDGMRGAAEAPSGRPGLATDSGWPCEATTGLILDRARCCRSQEMGLSPSGFSSSREARLVVTLPAGKLMRATATKPNVSEVSFTQTADLPIARNPISCMGWHSIEIIPDQVSIEAGLMHAPHQGPPGVPGIGQVGDRQRKLPRRITIRV
jgi:hypothetical protein